MFRMRNKRKKKIWKCKPCHKSYGTDYGRYLRHRRRRHSEAVQKGKEASNRTNYGQTAAEYDAQLKKQGNKCAACPRTAKNVSLHQDHRHSGKEFGVMLKIVVTKEGDWWVARNEGYGYKYRSHTRKKAKREVLRKLRRRVRRGILCWQCNAAIKKLGDNWKVARALSKYLRYWDKAHGWDNVNKKRIK